MEEEENEINKIRKRNLNLMRRRLRSSIVRRVLTRELRGECGARGMTLQGRGGSGHDATRALRFFCVTNKIILSLCNFYLSLLRSSPSYILFLLTKFFSFVRIEHTVLVFPKMSVDNMTLFKIKKSSPRAISFFLLTNVKITHPLSIIAQSYRVF